MAARFRRSAALLDSRLVEERGLGPNYLKMWTASAISNFGDGIDG
jgi:hypothetical protein